MKKVYVVSFLMTVGLFFRLDELEISFGAFSLGRTIGRDDFITI